MAKSRTELIDELASMTSRLVENQLTEGEPVALVDFPYAVNPGDCAIWLGTRKMLTGLGHPVRYLTDLGRYDADRLRKNHPSGPILLQGGGNLGDFWPEHQHLRMQVMRDFPERSIIQLPQTIGFKLASSQEEFAAALEAHGGTTLLVRDEVSRQVAAAMGAEAFTCPDMAFQLGDLKTHKSRSEKILVLARTDHESNGLRSHAEGSADSFGARSVSLEEWSMSATARARWQMSRTPHRVLTRIRPGSMFRPLAERFSMNAYDRMASIPFEAAIKQVDSAKIVVTDRLHTHIIAILLGVPHILVDNNYGKLSGIYSLFTESSTGSIWAEDAEDALRLIPEADAIDY